MSAIRTGWQCVGWVLSATWRLPIAFLLGGLTIVAAIGALLGISNIITFAQLGLGFSFTGLLGVVLCALLAVGGIFLIGVTLHPFRRLIRR